MPQRAIATDGVEWLAADMSFDQDGRDSDFIRRTVFQMGQAGVCAGGVVTDAGTRHIAISGPLHFTVNGELDEIVSPSNVLLGASDTWYIIAKHLTTDDTPATFYGAGSPPSKHRNVTPSIVVRNAGGGGAAVIGAGEANLATVTTNGSVVTGITDTRVVVPTVTNGNISLGGSKTIDGMDPSAHLTDVGDDSHAAHAFLAYSSLAGYSASIVGTAAPYNIALPYWWVSLYHHSQGTSFLPDYPSDFPFSGETLASFRVPTMYGTFWEGGHGPKWKMRCLLRFKAFDVSPATQTGYVLAVNDTMRIKLNGSVIFTASGTDETGNHTISFTPVQGDNELELLFNNDLDAFTFQFLTDFLANPAAFRFTPSLSP